MQDVGAVDQIFAGQRIDRDFGAGGAIGEIVERRAAAGLAVPMDLRRLVEAGGRQLHAGEIGLLDEIGEGDFARRRSCTRFGRKMTFAGSTLQLLGGEGDQPFLDLAGGVEGGHAVEVGAGGGGGRRGVRHLAGGRRGDLHAVDIDLEAVGQHLRHLGVEALAHLGAAMVQVDRAVLIDMHQRARLVEGGHGEGDAEFHRRQRDALADDSGWSRLNSMMALRRA